MKNPSKEFIVNQPQNIAENIIHRILKKNHSLNSVKNSLHSSVEKLPKKTVGNSL